MSQEILAITRSKLTDIKGALSGDKKLSAKAREHVDIALGLKEDEGFNPILKIVFDLLNGKLTIKEFVVTMRRLDVI